MSDPVLFDIYSLYQSSIYCLHVILRKPSLNVSTKDEWAFPDRGPYCGTVPGVLLVCHHTCFH